MWVGVPLVIAALITLAFGGQQGPQVTVDLLVADEDDSFLSGLLVGALSQGDAGNLFQVTYVDREAGRAQIEDDEGSALLVIPEGFGAALLREEPMELLLVTNPSQQVLPRIAEETVRILIDVSFYAHRILGDELRQFASWIDEDAEVADQDIGETSVRINRIAKQVTQHLDPLAIEVTMGVDDQQQEPEQAEAGEESSEEDKSDQKATAPASTAPKSVSPAFYFFPGMLVMALFFASDGLGADIWLERVNGTIRRLVTTPRSLTVYLAAKCVAAALLIAVVSLVLLLLGLIYFERPWEPLPLAAVWMVLSGVALWAIMVTVQLLATSQRAGTVLTSALTFPLLMLGGSFIPLETMPGWMASIGRATPNGWMLEHLKTILLGTVNPSSLLTAAAALIGVFVLFFFLASKRLYAIRTRT